MTVSALEALLLHHVLAEGETGIADRFFEQVATVVDLAWSLSVGPDRKFPETEGERPLPDRLVGRYVGRLQRRAREDPALSEVLGKVITLRAAPHGAVGADCVVASDLAGEPAGSEPTKGELSQINISTCELFPQQRLSPTAPFIKGGKSYVCTE